MADTTALAAVLETAEAQALGLDALADRARLLELVASHPIAVGAALADARAQAEPVALLMFAEGYFEDRREFESVAQARAFAAGALYGAGKYGAGSCSAYVVGDDDDEREMRKYERPEEVACAVASPRNPSARSSL